jgi:small subunit ribosomal protein S20
VADHASALKRHRQNVKRRLRNQAIKTRMRRLVRDVRQAIGSRDAAAAKSTLDEASKYLAKAVTKGVLHQNTAARRISRLSRAVNQLSS